MSTQPSSDVVAAPDMGRGVVTGASLDSRIRYADVLSHAGLVPTSYQGKPANVLYAVETGTMLGIHPIAAINGINVIQGKPTISPALMTALVRRAGHKVRVSVTGSVRNEDIVATCEVIRSDDPTFTYRAAWDVDRAKRAGLWGGRGAWSNYPEAMLKARAISEVCREAAEDALCGIHYIAEELGAAVNVEGEVIDQGAPTPQQPQQASAPTAPRVDADGFHALVYGARSKADLRAALAEADLFVPGKGFRRDVLESLESWDKDGTPLDGWSLVAGVGSSLPETTPPGGPQGPVKAAADDVQDAELVEDDTADHEPSAGSEHRQPTTKADPAKRHPAVSTAMSNVRAAAAKHAPHNDEPFEEQL